MSGRLNLNVLGRFEARLDSGEIVSLPTRKVEALLTYLALVPGQHSRDQLMNLLWSDRGEQQARNSLRQALSALKKNLDGIEPNLLNIEHANVRLASQSIVVDAVKLEELSQDQTWQAVNQAIALYRGEFMEGMMVRDSNGEEWLAIERERYRKLATDALHKLLEFQLETDNEKVVENGERLVSLDPLNESAWCTLMRVYASRGDRNYALMAYKRCCEVLNKELNVEPSQETTELQAAIRSGNFAFTKVHSAQVPSNNHVSAVTSELSVPSLSEKPSIAILPFTSISNDSEQEFLADGITDDIITNLSRFHDLFVIARNSSFVYKSKAVSVQDVSRELGVRYILEGSIQKSKDEIRINAQLIDGTTGSHIWAERYQRHVDDIFALQDDVVGLIVGTLASGYGGRLRKAWQRQGSKHPKAFDCFVCGLDFMDNFTPEDNYRAGECFKEAIRLNPNYGKAYAKLAWVYMLDAVESWSDNYEELLAKGLKAATRGIEVEDDESWAHWSLGAHYIYAQQYDLGLAEFERAIELNPNDADVLADAGFYYSYAGKADEGAGLIYRAMRINPHFPEYYLIQLGQALFDAHKYGKAVAAFARLRDVETTLSCLYTAASQAAIGNEGKATEAIACLLKHDPGATVEKWLQPGMSPYRNKKDAEHFGRYLRKAGLPE